MCAGCEHEVIIPDKDIKPVVVRKIKKIRPVSTNNEHLKKP